LFLRAYLLPEMVPFHSHVHNNLSVAPLKGYAPV
jgi:hypothetical protein